MKQTKHPPIMGQHVVTTPLSPTMADGEGFWYSWGPGYLHRSIINAFDPRFYRGLGRLAAHTEHETAVAAARAGTPAVSVQQSMVAGTDGGRWSRAPWLWVQLLQALLVVVVVMQMEGVSLARTSMSAAEWEEMLSPQLPDDFELRLRSGRMQLSGSGVDDGFVVGYKQDMKDIFASMAMDSLSIVDKLEEEDEESLADHRCSVYAERITKGRTLVPLGVWHDVDGSISSKEFRKFRSMHVLTRTMHCQPACGSALFKGTESDAQIIKKMPVSCQEYPSNLRMTLDKSDAISILSGQMNDEEEPPPASDGLVQVQRVAQSKFFAPLKTSIGQTYARVWLAFTLTRLLGCCMPSVNAPTGLLLETVVHAGFVENLVTAGATSLGRAVSKVWDPQRSKEGNVLFRLFATSLVSWKHFELAFILLGLLVTVLAGIVAPTLSIHAYSAHLKELRETAAAEARVAADEARAAADEGRAATASADGGNRVEMDE